MIRIMLLNLINIRISIVYLTKTSPKRAQNKHKISLILFWVFTKAFYYYWLVAIKGNYFYP